MEMFCAGRMRSVAAFNNVRQLSPEGEHQLRVYETCAKSSDCPHRRECMQTITRLRARNAQACRLRAC